ncbi:MAG: acetylglutamate kinase [Spirochaetales bacterium]|nr:acetylglutamate kinase [Spirochaetales bacterium]
MESVLIKIGGRAATDETAFKHLAREMKKLQGNYKFFFVHGGGAEVTKISSVFGLKAEFENGVRKTSPEEMEVVDMVLGGKMNKYIVRIFAAEGLRPVGISGCDGNIFTGTAIAEGSRTGRITNANPELLELLSSGGYLPVISSISMDMEGTALNINADEAALATAASLRADKLIFISDIPGILEDGAVIHKLTPEGIRQKIKDGVISGGMIPKAESSIEALNKGVGSVIIGGYSSFGDLESLIGGKLGSDITRD